MTLSPLGDAAVVISLGERVDEAIARRVRGLVREIEGSRLAGVTDVVGAFASVAVFYDPVRAGGLIELKRELEKAAGRASAAVDVEDEGRRIVLPVCYGGDHGPDLGAVAAHTRLSPEAVIAAHSGADYLVHAIGFVPGFPYLGGLPAELATPRRATPRARVPPGSVGIGGVQTGVYPLETPGGWNLIGRTPARLFDVARAEAGLLRAGDRVAFQPIDENEFAKLVTRTADGPRSTTTEGAEEVDVCVVRGGMLTTVQDGGRVGHRAEGVPLSGAADPVALRVANLVVGNQEAAAALEFTLLGPELRFARDAIVALAGADFGLPRWRPLRLAAGETLKIGAAAAGCRGYLAVAGGFAVSEVIGSRSTYLRGGFGGLGGRALRDGDGLHVAAVERRVSGNGGNWRIDERVLPAYSAAPTVRVIKGAQAEEFSSAWIQEEFEVTTQSDRMGARLRGAALTRNRTAELVSAPVAPGTIQVPPDGQPIVLLADAQTIGGYPQIAHVITVDLPLVAQLRPGDRVRFTEVSLEEAQALLLARERALGMLREGLAQKLA